MDPGGNSDDISLIEKAIRRDPVAFEKLITKYEERLLALLSSRLYEKNKIHSNDILQEAYLTAWEKIDTLRNPESFLSWLVIIVLNTAKRVCIKETGQKRTIHDFYQKTKKGILRLMKPFQSDASVTLEKEGHIRLLLETMEILPEEERQVVSLHYFTDCSYAEIANTLSISESQVKTRMKRAKGRLAKVMKAAAVGSLATYFHFSSPLPKVMAMIYSGETIPPAPEFLVVAGTTAVAATETAMKSASGASFWSVVTTIFSVPFLWLGSMLVSLQILALTLISNAPTFQAKLWLVKQILRCYGLTVIAYLILFACAFIGDIMGSQLTKALLPVFFAIIFVVFLYVVRIVYFYGKIRKSSYQIKEISYDRLGKTINHLFIAITAAFTILLGCILAERYYATSSVESVLACLAFGLTILLFHVIAWILFRRLLIRTKLEDIVPSPENLKKTETVRTLNEMKYVFPAFVLTTLGSLLHIVFVREQNTYMSCEFFLFSFVWCWVVQKNANSPEKRASRILITISVLITLVFFQRFYFGAS